jgi:hypothetical protein
MNGKRRLTHRVLRHTVRSAFILRQSSYVILMLLYNIRITKVDGSSSGEWGAVAAAGGGVRRGFGVAVADAVGWGDGDDGAAAVGFARHGG